MIFRRNKDVRLLTAAIAAIGIGVGVIDAANSVSIRLHESLGFSHCGTIRQAGFKFHRWLDVVFANLFFGALRDALLEAGPAAKAWAPLLEARGRPGVLPLQFALAGMNAHINRDLPLALVATCEARRVEPRDGSPQQRDYRQINQLLERVEGRVKQVLVTDALRAASIFLASVSR